MHVQVNARRLKRKKILGLTATNPAPEALDDHLSESYVLAVSRFTTASTAPSCIMRRETQPAGRRHHPQTTLIPRRRPPPRCLSPDAGRPQGRRR